MDKKYMTPNYLGYFYNPNVLQTGRSHLYNTYARLNW